MSKDLLKAAESGNATVFESLSQQLLLKSYSLMNEDARSLLHVSTSSGFTEVVNVFSVDDLLVSGINSGNKEGWVLLLSTTSSGHAELLRFY